MIGETPGGDGYAKEAALRRERGREWGATATVAARVRGGLQRLEL